MQEQPKYWFPAKRYGWGWGMPSSWQGWAVLAIYFCLLIAGTVLLPPNGDPRLYLIFVMGLSILLVAICWLKGEPPRWRWGK